VHQTGNFQSDIVAVVKEKKGQYTAWVRLDDALKLMTFKMLHVCTLKGDPTKKQVACNCHTHKQETNCISNIIYSKLPLPAEAELMH